MANATCYTPLQVCALRVAKLNSTGDAVAGAATGYVSDALIEATLGLEIEEGDEIIKKNGCGDICVNFKDSDRIKRATVTLNLCKLDSELIYLLTGGTLIQDGSTTIGMKVQNFDDDAIDGVCLELWTKAWNGSAQAAPTITGSVNSYFHFVLPKARFQLSDLTLANADSEIPVSGTGEENAGLNIDGPYNDWPTAVTQAGGFDSVVGWFLDDAIPTAACGFTTVPAQGS